MANLSTLLQARTDQLELKETNLEEGRVYAFADANMYSASCNGFCWKSPDTGIAKIEMWGAGGSGAMQCCCAMGIPGNPGAYSKRCICVVADCPVYGILGRSCNNADSLCFRGCSEPTQLCWFGRTRAGASEDGCMCAQGGRGGVSYCMDGGSPYCCFVKCGHCNTAFTPVCCGLICNYGAGIVGDGNREILNCCTEAYGGQLNCRGGFSCSSFKGCRPDCVCCHEHHIAVPPGIFADEGAVFTFNGENNNSFQHWTGNYFTQAITSLNGLNRSPQRAVPANMTCWNGVKACGNSNMSGCMNIMPYGVGGWPAAPCDGSRSMGGRGGLGAVRITFYKDRTR